MIRALVAASVAMAGFSPANAAQIEILSVSGDWDVLSVVGPANVTGEGTEEIRWGEAFPGYDGTRSGFRFDAAEDSGPFDINTTFDVGIFTHMNNVIYQNAYLDVARLDVTIEAAFDGIVRQFSTFFDISLWETPNLANPCANGKENFVAGTVNRNGCADRARLLNNNSLTDVFTVGSLTYTFELLGFVDWGRDFWTVEQRDNEAVIQARFTVIEDREEPPTPPVVPLPAGLWALLTALGGFGLLRRLSARR